MEIGAQLYTVRNYCKDLNSFAETLKKIADIGYKNVQISATCAFEGEWLNEQLKKNGLKCVLTHTPREELINDTKAVALKHDAFSCKYVGLGYNDFKSDDDGQYDEFYKTFKPVAKALKENGKLFMYHNHNMEFRRLLDGTLVIERMANDFKSDELGFILDTFWIQAGGADPALWIEKFAGRIPVIHLKDYCYRPHLETKFSNYFAPIGEGNINFDRVFAAAQKSGVRYMLVEQDDCYGEDPFLCLKRSYDYLVSCGF